MFREGVGPLRAKGGDAGNGSETLIAHTLRGEGFDASEDGTGRGTPLVAVSFNPQAGGKQTSLGFDPGAGTVGSLGCTVTPAIAYQCQGTNVGEMGTLRKGDGGTTSGVSFIINAAESCAVASHARPTETARCIDSTGSFANAQGGTVVMEPTPIDMRQASRGATMTNNRPEGSSGGAPGTGIGEPGDPSPSLSLSHPPAIAFMERGREQGRTVEWQEDIAYAQDVKSGGGAGSSRWVAARSAVRRLTPEECEKLQGFPPGYTLVPFRGKPAADGNRYKALGNSFAVPVVAWIGRRIEMVEKLTGGAG